MRIAVAVCNYLPYRAGITNVAERHAHHLEAIGHKVTVLCPAHDQAPGSDVVDGIHVRRFRQAVRHGNSALTPTIARGLVDADALYLHYPFFGGAESLALAAFARGVPVVTFFHMDVIRSGLEGRVLWAYECSIARIIMERSAVVFASSLDYARHSSIRRYRLPQLEAFPYCVDASGYAPGAVPEATRRRLGIDPQRGVILFVGAMDGGHAFKGVPELISAVSSADLVERAQLVLVGDGDLRPTFERQATASLGTDGACFLGRLPEDDLKTVLRAADVLVLPSTTQEEAFGIVLIEAQASGTPVVASALPGVRELVTEDTGRLVPPRDVPALADAIGDLVSDPDLLRSLSSHARRRAVEHFSHERERRQLEETFGSLPSKTRPRMARIRSRFGSREPADRP
ncbi:MAG: glycosyltransferase family 4 protein [Thermoleophilia bacterium]